MKGKQLLLPGEHRYILRFGQLVAIAVLPALLAFAAGFAWGHAAALRGVAVHAQR